MTTKASTIFPKPIGEVSKASLDSAVSTLEASIAKLPTSATTDAIKADTTKLKADLLSLDTSKASQKDLDTLSAANKALDTSLKTLAALPPDVSQAELDAAIADYKAKIKSVDDALVAAKASIESALPVTPGKTVDLNAIKLTSSGICQGGNLTGAPSNLGANVFATWGYVGDATSGVMNLSVWAAPDNRQVEGNWVRAKTAGTWGNWAIAPKAGDYQTTTGNRTVVTGESWLVGNGHVVNLNYLDATKTIKLKPLSGNWANVPQPTASAGFTVPAKPTSGSEVVEYKVNTGTGAWEVVPATPDPVKVLSDRVDKLEGLNNDFFALDKGFLFTAAEAIGVEGLVHLRLSDRKIIAASDTDPTKKADGIILSTVAAGGTVKVYGTGTALETLNVLTGLSEGADMYLGSSSAIALSPSLTAKLIQHIGVYRNGRYRFNFDTPVHEVL